MVVSSWRAIEAVVKVHDHARGGAPYIPLAIGHGVVISLLPLPLAAVPQVVFGAHQESERHLEYGGHLLLMRREHEAWPQQGHHRNDLEGSASQVEVEEAHGLDIAFIAPCLPLGFAPRQST